MSDTGLWGGSPLQRTRLVTGLVLFAFTATHFLNHALGIVSLDAMMAFDGWRVAVIRSVPGTVVLAGAFLIHAGLAAWRVIERRTLRLPSAEWVRLASGFAIPLLLVPHVVNTRAAATLFGVVDTYPYELARIWPGTFVLQGTLLLLVWVHGCFGLHFWLTGTSWYPRVAAFLFSLAVLLPFAALVGVSVQGRLVAASLETPSEVSRLRDATHWPDAAAAGVLKRLAARSQDGYLLVLGLIVTAVMLRLLLAHRARRIPIRYSGGTTVRAELGPTLLEVSQRHGIPHQSACGGRGRCSTCRVLVLEGENLPAPSEAELRTLRSIGATAGVRLACQLRPTGPITVLPLLKAVPSRVAPGTVDEPDPAGIERELAVLFVDMRGFTALTERRLPFDVIYILNQFFSAVAAPVRDQGGWIANYAGDGLIALFGSDGGVEPTCRSALIAVAEIDRAVAALNERLAGELHQPIRIAMGLHVGLHVMGRIGADESRSMSVVGLAMNVASRFETLAKASGVQLALSGTVAAHGALAIDGLRSELTEVRGLSAPIEVVFVKAARELELRLRQPVAAE